jgi:hypothetical protein
MDSMWVSGARDIGSIPIEATLEIIYHVFYLCSKEHC